MTPDYPVLVWNCACNDFISEVRLRFCGLVSRVIISHNTQTEHQGLVGPCLLMKQDNKREEKGNKRLKWVHLLLKHHVQCPSTFCLFPASEIKSYYFYHHLREVGHLLLHLPTVEEFFRVGDFPAGGSFQFWSSLMFSHRAQFWSESELLCRNCGPPDLDPDKQM